MTNLYRGHAIDASYQASVHLAKRFQRRRFFRNQPIRNKNCQWQPCLLPNRDEMSNFIEDLPQIVPTMFRFIQQSGFRGEDFQKLTNQKQELPVVAMFVNELGQNEQSSQRTFQGNFLPNFGSFGKTDLEEKIIQKSTNQKQELPVVAMFVYRSG